MKTILIGIFSLMISSLCYAQLEDGTLAPNFTATDIYGNEHELYEYLEQGYTVVLDFFTTWCIGCWQVHSGQFYATGPDQLGPMEYLYQEHSVENGGNMILLMIEDDSETDLGCLYGTPIDGWPGSTQGDWVSGNDVPIIDNTNIASMYGVGGYTTYVVVCPDGRILSTQVTCLEELNTCSMGEILEYMAQSQECSVVPNIGADVSIMSYAGGMYTCDQMEFIVNIANVGTDPLNSVDFEINGCEPPIYYEWTGILAPFETETVSLGTSSVIGPVTITALEENGISITESIALEIIYPIPSENDFKLTLTLDDAPEDVGWEIRDNLGNTLYEVPVGTYTSSFEDYTLIQEFNLPDGQCYEFILKDSFGDGLTYYMSDGVDQPGSCFLDSYNSNEEIFSNVFSYYGDWQYNEVVRYFDVGSEISNVPDVTTTLVSLYPNPVTESLYLEVEEAFIESQTFDIFNQLGEHVLSVPVSDRYDDDVFSKIDVGWLPSGIYYLKFVANGQNYTFRFVKI